MEKTEFNCNLCEGKKNSFLFTNYDHSIKSNQTFNIVRCTNCGLVYVKPKPSNMEKYYLDNYEPYNSTNKDIYFSLYKILMISFYKKKKNLFDLLKSALCQILYSPPAARSGKVLDIGCGNGGYLSVLKESGWKVYGLDFSQKAVNFAKNKRGLTRVKQGNAETLKYPDNFFDLVTMNHLIEHLSNPKKALIEAKRVLKKGGILAITTPNYSSFNAKIFVKNWFPLETPRHLFLFETLTLRKMIERIKGLKIVRIRHDYSTYCFARSLGYFLGNKSPINCCLMIIKIIFWPYTIFLSLFNRSDIMTFNISKVGD